MAQAQVEAGDPGTNEYYAQLAPGMPGIASVRFSDDPSTNAVDRWAVFLGRVGQTRNSNWALFRLPDDPNTDSNGAPHVFLHNANFTDV